MKFKNLEVAVPTSTPLLSAFRNERYETVDLPPGLPVTYPRAGSSYTALNSAFFDSTSDHLTCTFYALREYIMTSSSLISLLELSQ